MIVLGLTGGVGMGKSTVARMLARRGAAVIDTDAIVHELLRPGAPGWRRVVRAFGSEMVTRGRQIDRRALAALVFRQPAARHRLERLLHPLVRAEVRARLSRLRRRRAKVAVVDVPLLFETGFNRLVDRTLVVRAPAAVVQQRLRRRGWSASEVRRRAAAQWTVSAKAALADVVIDNGDGIVRTQRQVARLWQTL